MRTKQQQSVVNVVESLPFKALSGDAQLVFFYMLLYASEDGFISDLVVNMRADVRAELVAAGVIEPYSHGWYVAGYHKSGRKEAQEKAEADALFDELWREYPRKEGKASVKPKRRLEIAKVGKERMLEAIDTYKRKIIGKDREYVMMGSTFFNGRYEDYLAQEEPQPFTDAPNGKYEEPAY